MLARSVDDDDDQQECLELSRDADRISTRFRKFRRTLERENAWSLGWSLKKRGRVDPEIVYDCLIR